MTVTKDTTGGATEDKLGRPGAYPYTRGIYPEMYAKGRLWTMRQYAGFGSAEESNARYRYLLSQGTTGLSVAFDLPTQLGLDPDHPLARGEVGKVGVSIATLDDMRTLFRDIPLGEVTTSMTINAPAMMLLALYILVAEEQGVASERLGGTVQNDILKEYIARGTYIYPPEPSMRLITDTFAFCAKRVPSWNTISISGYHIREAGATAAQEIAFTLANAKAYVRAALERGLALDTFAPRLSFFFACHNDIFEEVAKFRAARRLWARVMKGEFGAQNPKSQMLRFHTQTGGSTLTAQQPENNIVRTAYQALAAVLGGTQSLHTNALDEALGLPTDRSARIALRTQQILAYESGVTREPDPLGGSFLVERLTDELEAEAEALIARVEDLGGSVRAIEAGFIQEEIEEAAFRFQREVETGERVVVGVNRFRLEQEEGVPIQQLSAETEGRRVEEVRRYREGRDDARLEAALRALAGAAAGDENLFPFVLDAFRAKATLGEVCGVLRRVWGEYRG
ncbi:acyl-CoA mutase large subunit family protein [Truepera radiovictrix]|uniref:Methylmalonyl-CoA mutase, large subunit n=1 Tax=Truepera radiovictrix (strain DSM 17093 / CIP 108686 / LMG 22925 / RQ-24) TaxID=649638 RepID=D7CSB8_TRURR|nr:methylmalonyl-CoA mutase family protein [Truepera radiovictrix]ADI13650.1 methylmalonyl-CoA mutase, large subunit [Truepera radiovictrix DSM 17093]WMT57788.1 methylmalonyl-CoA mutase family protein [Truepera radiovictrix]